jgi:glycosyltransferase involved in cell wall biosynthesis
MKHKKGCNMITIASRPLFTLLIFFIFSLSAENLWANDKYFVIVIPSYKNAQWYEQNLASVLAQDYTQFHVIYTDDCSPDNTGNLVERYLQDYDIDHKVTLIKNSVRRGALCNLYRMIYMCNDEAIIVTLDGDDWFPDDQVLNRLNAVYSSGDIWLTYGQFKLYPSETLGWASAMPDYIVENNSFRDFQHLPTHLRTFYSWLFKEIKLEDLLYLGQFYPMTWDMVMMFPMIEMAAERHQFIADVMYIYNDANVISDHHVSRQLQAHLAQVVKKKKRYKRLAAKPTAKKDTTEIATDVIIFSRTPVQLAQLLESMDTYATGIGSISVMYQPLSAKETTGYQSLMQKYPEVKFHFIDEYRSNFQKTLLDLYQHSTNDYLLFSKGDVFFHDFLSLSDCIHYLQQTYAYAFYFNLNAHDGKKMYPHMPLIEYTDDIVAWNFSLMRDKWSSANSLDLVLHKKSDSFATALQSYYDLTPNGLELTWGNEGNLDRLGLCFSYDKASTRL